MKQFTIHYLKRFMMLLLYAIALSSTTMAQEWVVVEEIDLTSSTGMTNAQFMANLPDNYYAYIGYQGELKYNAYVGESKIPIYFSSKGNAGEFFCIKKELEPGNYRFTYRIRHRYKDSNTGNLSFFYSKGDPASAEKVKVADNVSFSEVYADYTYEFVADEKSNYNMGFIADIEVPNNDWAYYLISYFILEKKSDGPVEKYTISWTNPTNGSIVVKNRGIEINSGDQVSEGTTLTVEATPNSGYKLASLMAGSLDITESKSFVVNSDTEITAVFEFDKWSQVVYKEFIGTDKGLTKTHTGIWGVYSSDWGVNVPNLYDYNNNLNANKDEYIAVEHTIEEGETGIYKFSYEMYTTYGNTYIFFCRNTSTNENIFEEAKTLAKKAAEKHIETGEFTIDEPGTYLFGWYLNKSQKDDIYIRSFELLKKDEAPVTPTNCIIKWEQPSAGGKITVMKGSETLVSQSKVEYGTELTVIATPDSGYELSSLTANGNDLISTGGKFNVTSDTEIIAIFKEIIIVNENMGWKVTVPEVTDGNFPAGEYNRIEIDGSILSGNRFTLETWVKLDAAQPSLLGHGSIIMGFRTDATKYGYNENPYFSLYLNNISGNTAYAKSWNSYESFFDSDIPLGEFVHIAVTVDNGAFASYINGERIPNGHSDSYSTINQFGTIVFGECINAVFSDIMIWNKILSQDEIKASMNGYTSSQDGLLGYYLLDYADDSGESESVGTSSVPAKYATVTTYEAATSVDYTSRAFKTDLTGVSEDITAERPEPRGGAKFFEGESDITWANNGNENFGYFFKTSDTKRLAYNGIDKVALPENIVAVYHNGDATSPVYVTTEDYETMNGNNVTTSSYVVSGLEYTVTMPAAKVWMPLSLPENVDLVYDNDDAVNLRPMWNFWYSTFNSEYADADSYSDIWNSFVKVDDETASKTYELIQPGIISVPETRAGHSFTFYTKIDKPVVVRALNAEYNASLMPSEAGKIKFVTNPYSFTVNTSELVTSGMDIYRFNETSGNFEIVTEAADLNVYEPVMVFNNGGGAFKSPRYIGTKAVSGIIEYEAVYDVNVRGTEGAVEVETFIPADVEIFDTNGMAVAAGHVEGTHRFTLETGIYIVRTVVEGGTETFKVVVE